MTIATTNIGSMRRNTGAVRHASERANHTAVQIERPGQLVDDVPVRICSATSSSVRHGMQQQRRLPEPDVADDARQRHRGRRRRRRVERAQDHDPHQAEEHLREEAGECGGTVLQQRAEPRCDDRRRSPSPLIQPRDDRLDRRVLDEQIADRVPARHPAGSARRAKRPRGSNARHTRSPSRRITVASGSSTIASRVVDDRSSASARASRAARSSASVPSDRILPSPITITRCTAPRCRPCRAWSGCTVTPRSRLSRCDELAHRELGDRVEADRRLVEEQDRRRVQQRRGEIARACAGRGRAGAPACRAASRELEQRDQLVALRA